MFMKTFLTMVKNMIFLDVLRIMIILWLNNLTCSTMFIILLLSTCPQQNWLKPLLILVNFAFMFGSTPPVRLHNVWLNTSSPSAHLYFNHSYKKRKDGLETQAALFWLQVEISWVAVHSIHQNSENGEFCKELLSENDFEAVLVTFCCYGHGGKASEAVQRIAADQKEYRKCI